MKVGFLVSIILFASTVYAQRPEEMEFNALPCTAPGSIDSRGETCTIEDVREYKKDKAKILTAEEKKIEKLSKKKDPLKILDANKKRSKGVWVRSGGNN